MAKVYAALIRKGLKTLDDVPANLRDAACFISVEKGGARHGCCVRYPHHQGPQDH